MVEGVGHLAPVGLALKVVVADLGGYVDGILYITRLDGVEHGVVAVGPYSGETVGL